MTICCPNRPPGPRAPPRRRTMFSAGAPRPAHRSVPRNSRPKPPPRIFSFRVAPPFPPLLSAPSLEVNRRPVARRLCVPPPATGLPHRGAGPAAPGRAGGATGRCPWAHDRTTWLSCASLLTCLGSGGGRRSGRQRRRRAPAAPPVPFVNFLRYPAARRTAPESALRPPGSSHKPAPSGHRAAWPTPPAPRPFPGYPRTAALPAAAASANGIDDRILTAPEQDGAGFAGRRSCARWRSAEVDVLFDAAGSHGPTALPRSWRNESLRPVCPRWVRAIRARSRGVFCRLATMVTTD